MKRTIFTLCFTLLLSQLACAHQPAEISGVGISENAAQEVMALSRAKWLWMADQDMEALTELFHEEAVFVHMGGTMSRERELEIIRSGGIHYKHAEIQDASVRFVGNTAIVLNTIRLDAVVGGNEVSNPFEVTEVYVWDGEAWKLGSLSFTRLLR